MGWEWSWPHFTPRELACKCPVRGWGYCAGEYFHDYRFLNALEALRLRVGHPLPISSARRCPQYNAMVGGAPLSQHKLALAVDIPVAGERAKRLVKEAAFVGFRGIGFGVGFVHLDMRPRRRAFHYPGGRKAWTGLFGFDPKPVFDATGGFEE